MYKKEVKNKTFLNQSNNLQKQSNFGTISHQSCHENKKKKLDMN